MVHRSNSAQNLDTNVNDDDKRLSCSNQKALSTTDLRTTILQSANSDEEKCKKNTRTSGRLSLDSSSSEKSRLKNDRRGSSVSRKSTTAPISGDNKNDCETSIENGKQNECVQEICVPCPSKSTTNIDKECSINKKCSKDDEQEAQNTVAVPDTIQSPACAIICSLPLERLSGIMELLKLDSTRNDSMDKTNTAVSLGPVNRTLCLYCDRSFSSHNLYVKHAERIHHAAEGRRLSSRNLNVSSLLYPGCSHCNSGKITSLLPDELPALFEHLVDIHFDKYFACKPCTIRFPSKDGLQTHLDDVHQDRAKEKSPPKNIIYDKRKKKSLKPFTKLQNDLAAIVDPQINMVARVILEPVTEPLPMITIPTITTSTTTTPTNSTTNSPTDEKGNSVELRSSKRQQAKQASTRTSKTLPNDDPMLSRLGIAQNRSPRSTRRQQQKNQRITPPENVRSETPSTRPIRSKTTRLTNAIASANVSQETVDISPIAASRPSGSSKTEVLSCTFDENFYETVNQMVRLNLSCHIDGKLESGPTSPSPVRIPNAEPAVLSTLVKSPLVTDNEIHEATSLTTVTAFPTLLTAQQYGTEPMLRGKIKKPITKNSWKWKWDCVKKYKYVNEGGKVVKKIKQPIAGLRDLSKLDMWTQLTMRTKHEEQQRQAIEISGQTQHLTHGEVAREEKRQLITQLNSILDRRILPQITLEQNDQRIIKLESSGDESCSELIPNSISTDVPTSSADDLLRMLCLSRTEQMRPDQNPKITLSGEWARPRCYICFGCGGKFENIKALDDHQSQRHPYVYSTHYEIVGKELIDGNLFRHFYIPSAALKRHTNTLSQSATAGTASEHKENILMEDSMDSIASLSKSDSFDTDSNSRISKTSVSTSGTSTTAGTEDVPIANKKLCTKCNRICNGTVDLYRHMLDCSGDYAWLLAKKRQTIKYRYFGSRRRRVNRSQLAHRRPIVRPKKEEGESSPRVKEPQAPRSKPSDAESIQRMLANLPAKRASRQLFPNLLQKRVRKFANANAVIRSGHKQILVKPNSKNNTRTIKYLTTSPSTRSTITMRQKTPPSKTFALPSSSGLIRKTRSSAPQASESSPAEESDSTVPAEKSPDDLLKSIKCKTRRMVSKITSSFRRPLHRRVLRSVSQKTEDFKLKNHRKPTEKLLPQKSAEKDNESKSQKNKSVEKLSDKESVLDESKAQKNKSAEKSSDKGSILDEAKAQKNKSAEKSSDKGSTLDEAKTQKSKSAEKSSDKGSILDEAKAQKNKSAEKSSDKGSTLDEAKTQKSKSAEKSSDKGSILDEAKAQKNKSAEKSSDKGSILDEAKAQKNKSAEKSSDKGSTLDEAKTQKSKSAEKSSDKGSILDEAKAQKNKSAEKSSDKGSTLDEAKTQKNKSEKLSDKSSILDETKAQKNKSDEKSSDKGLILDEAKAQKNDKQNYKKKNEKISCLKTKVTSIKNRTSSIRRALSFRKSQRKLTQSNGTKGNEATAKNELATEIEPSGTDKEKPTGTTETSATKTQQPKKKTGKIFKKFFKGIRKNINSEQTTKKVTEDVLKVDTAKDAIDDTPKELVIEKIPEESPIAVDAVEIEETKISDESRKRVTRGESKKLAVETEKEEKPDEIKPAEASPKEEILVNNQDQSKQVTENNIQGTLEPFSIVVPSAELTTPPPTPIEPIKTPPFARKRTRKLNDCIAMLTGKLQEKLGVPFLESDCNVLLKTVPNTTTETLPTSNETNCESTSKGKEAEIDKNHVTSEKSTSDISPRKKRLREPKKIIARRQPIQTETIVNEPVKVLEEKGGIEIALDLSKSTSEIIVAESVTIVECKLQQVEDLPKVSKTLPADQSHCEDIVLEEKQIDPVQVASNVTTIQEKEEPENTEKTPAIDSPKKPSTPTKQNPPKKSTTKSIAKSFEKNTIFDSSDDEELLPWDPEIGFCNKNSDSQTSTPKGLTKINTVCSATKQNVDKNVSTSSENGQIDNVPKLDIELSSKADEKKVGNEKKGDNAKNVEMKNETKKVINEKKKVDEKKKGKNEKKVNELINEKKKSEEMRNEKKGDNEKKVHESKVVETKVNETKVDETENEKKKDNEQKVDGMTNEKEKEVDKKNEETKDIKKKVGEKKGIKKKVEAKKNEEKKDIKKKAEVKKTDKMKANEKKEDEKNIEEKIVDEKKVEKKNEVKTKNEEKKEAKTKIEERKEVKSKNEEKKEVKTKNEEKKEDEDGKIDNKKKADTKIVPISPAKPIEKPSPKKSTPSFPPSIRNRRQTICIENPTLRSPTKSSLKTKPKPSTPTPLKTSSPTKPDVAAPSSVTTKPRKRRKNELAQIIADQLLESFKEVDQSRLEELKLLHDLSIESKPDELLLKTKLSHVQPPKRKTVANITSEALIDLDTSFEDTDSEIVSILSKDKPKNKSGSNRTTKTETPQLKQQKPSKKTNGNNEQKPSSEKTQNDSKISKETIDNKNDNRKAQISKRKIGGRGATVKTDEISENVPVQRKGKTNENGEKLETNSSTESEDELSIAAHKAKAKEEETDRKTIMPKRKANDTATAVEKKKNDKETPNEIPSNDENDVWKVPPPNWKESPKKNVNELDTKTPERDIKGRGKTPSPKRKDNSKMTTDNTAATNGRRTPSLRRKTGESVDKESDAQPSKKPNQNTAAKEEPKKPEIDDRSTPRLRRKLFEKRDSEHTADDSTSDTEKPIKTRAMNRITPIDIPSFDKRLLRSPIKIADTIDSRSVTMKNTPAKIRGRRKTIFTDKFEEIKIVDTKKVSLDDLRVNIKPLEKSPLFDEPKKAKTANVIEKMVEKNTVKKIGKAKPEATKKGGKVSKKFIAKVTSKSDEASTESDTDTIPITKLIEKVNAEKAAASPKKPEPTAEKLENQNPATNSNAKDINSLLKTKKAVVKLNPIPTIENGKHTSENVEQPSTEEKPLPLTEPKEQAKESMDKLMKKPKIKMGSVKQRKTQKKIHRKVASNVNELVAQIISDFTTSTIDSRDASPIVFGDLNKDALQKIPRIQDGNLLKDPTSQRPLVLKNKTLENVMQLDRLSSVMKSPIRAPFMSPRWEPPSTDDRTTETNSGGKTAHFPTATPDVLLKEPILQKLWPTGKKPDEPPAPTVKLLSMEKSLFQNVKDKTKKLFGKISKKKNKKPDLLNIKKAILPQTGVPKRPLLRPSILSANVFGNGLGNSSAAEEEVTESLKKLESNSLFIGKCLDFEQQNSLSKIFAKEKPADEIGNGKMDLTNGNSMPAKNFPIFGGDQSKKLFDQAAIVSDQGNSMNKNPNNSGRKKKTLKRRKMAGKNQRTVVKDLFAREKPLDRTDDLNTAFINDDRIKLPLLQPLKTTSKLITNSPLNEISQDTTSLSDLVDKIKDTNQQSESEEDLCLAAIAKSLNNKIMNSDEFVNELDSPPAESTDVLPPSQKDTVDTFITSVNKKLADVPHEKEDPKPDFLFDQDENTNTDLIDMDLEDNVSVYTSFSIDTSITSGGSRGRKKRRQRRSINFSRKKKAADTFLTPSENYFCEICVKTFRTAGGLSTHKMTLTHISKLSEQEFLKSKLDEPKCQKIPDPPCEDDLTPAEPEPAEAISNTTDVGLEEGHTTPTSCPPTAIEQKPDEAHSEDASPPKEQANSIVSPARTQQQHSYLNLCGIEPISSPEQMDFTYDRYASVTTARPSVALSSLENSRLTLSQEERLFYECCSMLKGSDRSLLPSTSPNKYYHPGRIGEIQPSKPVTPKSNEQYSSYLAPETSKHSRGIPKIDLNQFSDISSDSNPAFSCPQVPSSAETHNLFPVQKASGFGVGEFNGGKSTILDKHYPSTAFADMRTSFPPFHKDSKENENYVQTILQRTSQNLTDEAISDDRHSHLPDTTKILAAEHGEIKIDSLLLNSSPIHSTSPQSSSMSRLRTKAALKGYENLKVSIPTTGLDMQQALNRSPNPAGCKLAALADIALGNDVPLAVELIRSPCIDSPETPTTATTVPFEEPEKQSILDPINSPPVVVNATKTANKICKKKTIQSVPKSKKKLSIAQKSKANKSTVPSALAAKAEKEPAAKTKDVYDFDDSRDSIDQPLISLSQARSKVTEADATAAAAPAAKTTNEIEEGSPASSYSDRDDFNYDSVSESESSGNESHASSAITSRSIKSINNVQKKCLIMGRIFKAAKKAEAQEKPQPTTKKPIPKQELDKLFDSLRGAKKDKQETEKESMKTDKDAALGKPSQSSNSSNRNEDSDEKSRRAAERRSRKPREIANLEAEWGMTMEQIIELIGVGQRKTQRRCAANKQRTFAETWSSDEYEDFHSTRDIIALVQEAEKNARRARCRSAAKKKNAEKSELSKEEQQNGEKSNTVDDENTAIDSIIDDDNRVKDSGLTSASESKPEAKKKSAKEKVAKESDKDKENKQGAKVKAKEPPPESIHERKKKKSECESSVATGAGVRPQVKAKPRKSMTFTAAATAAATAATTESESDDNDFDDEWNRKVKRSSKISKRRKTIAFREDVDTKSETRTVGKLDSTSKPIDDDKKPETIRHSSTTKPPKPMARRKRVASEMLYYWSSSSDEEFGRIKPRENYDDDNLEQHGWIVGDSHKKLVTLLAHAKGKKIEDCGVKEAIHKKKS